MTQNPGQWGPQGGYPPQGQGSYPPQQPSPGYPPQQPGPGYPPQGGYAPQPGYNPQGTYAPQGGYPPQGPQPPQDGGYIPPPAEPTKKSPAMIIGIVVAAVVLLAAVGGIIMVLTGDGEEPPPVTITPSQPVPPTEQPTEQPTAQPSTDQPQPTPSESSTPPSGEAVDLGKGISLAPAPGWEVEKTGQGVAQLSDDQSVFLGQAIQVEPSTNPGQLCDAWHRKVAEGSSNGKFAEPQPVDLGTTKLKAAVCNAQVTVSNGQGSTTILMFSLVSVRQSDGVTVIGTIYFTPNVDTQQLDKDFSLMINSMLQGQAKG